MRTRMSAALGLTLTLALGACGRAADGGGIATADGTPKASSSATTGPVDDREQMLKYAKCMRENGVPKFKDPKPGEGIRIAIGPGDDKAAVDKALEACKSLLPNGGVPPKLSAEMIEKARQMARCMRENGVPKFPDPGPNGELKIDGDKLGLSGPDDPAMKKAEKLCARYLPKGLGGDGPGTERHTS